MAQVSSSMRTRVFMFIMVIVILIAFAGLYVTMKQIGAQRARLNKHSFYQYVVTHHIGTLVDIDDGTGFDPESYNLILTHRVADNQLEEYAAEMMKVYVKDDHGQALTILYEPTSASRAVPMADINYNDDEEQVSITVTTSSGAIYKYVRHVHW